MKTEPLCLHQLFQNQAERTPEALAVVDQDKAMTYRELDRITDKMAGFLQRQGVTFDKPAGIFMETCMEYLIAYIGILKAGGAYIPLELAYPDALLQKILDEAQPKAIVTKRRHRSRFNSDFSAKPLYMDVDDVWKATGTYDKDAVASISLDHLAFVAYTSGTTGDPKGVLVPHRAVVHSYTSRYNQSSYQPNDRVACNIFFVWEILRPLLKGATCHIIPDDIIYDPRPLLDYLADHKINEVLFTPSLLETIINSVDAEKIRSKLSSLKVIWLNGEVVTVNLKNRVLSILPNHVRLLNTYSISECHDVADSDLRHAEDLPSGFCTVGHPIPGVELKLLDEQLQCISSGGVGELYVGGPCLARGYLNKPDLTAERFVWIDGDKYYKTGDLAKIHQDGKLEIKGRCDYMVKIRGYSIHLGAVETALLEHANVKSCAVIAAGEEGDEKRLIAYVVRDEAAHWKIDERTGISIDIRNILKHHLPHYMIPGVYVELNKIPLHPVTGKLNHKLLPTPPRKYRYDFQDISLDKDASENEQKAVMRLLWERILLLDEEALHPDANFFDYGGHSLLAVELTIAIEEIFGTPLLVKDIYEYPTVKALVKYINSGMTGEVAQISIKEDAYLDPSIVPAPLMKPRSISNAGSIFITGTTGFLGAFLLAEILRTTKDDVKVYCLVRVKADKQQEASRRIIDNLTYYNLFQPKFKERIIPVAGDLTSKYFGWPAAQFKAMSDTIDYIFHCASLVNYVYSYAVIKPAAVNGTGEILRLACTSATKPIHYISTNGIFPGEDNTVYLENSDIDALADKLENGYGQAKWVAEKLIWQAASRKFPVCLYRPGNIGHHQSTGAANPNDFQTMIIDACRKVNCAPSADNWSFEMTPVDFLVKAIAVFAQAPSHFGKVYNVVADNPVPAQAVFDLLLDRRVISEYVSLDEWKARLISKARDEDDHILQVLAQSLGDVERFLNDSSVYDTSRFAAALSTHGLQRPILDAEYFMKLLD